MRVDRFFLARLYVTAPNGLRSFLLFVFITSHDEEQV